MQDGSKSQEQLLMEREEILRQLAEMGDDGEDISDSDEEEGEEECINMSDGEVQVKKEEHDSIETSPVENTLIPPESPPNSVKSELKVENENENENENEEEEKSTAKGDSEPPVPVKKIVLERIDHDKTIPLPDGWSFITHESGMIVYFHKQTRVVTHSRPYQVECPVRDHKVPVFAIPCLYRSIIDEEKNNADSQNAVDSLESVEQADTPCEKIPPANKEIPYCWNQNENLSPMDFRKFCEKRFRFKEMTIMRYTNPREREKAQQERKANAILKRSGFGVDYKNILEKNEPGNFVLSSPSGAILIDLTPLEKGKRSGPRKPFLLNPMGKTTVSVLNEFVQRLVKGALVYEAEDTRNVSCPYKATAVLSMKRSTLQEMSQECRESLIVLCEIAAMNDDPNSGTEDIAKFPIGKGVGANKKTSRLSAAKDALSKLVPKLRISDDYICEGVLDEATKNDFDRESRELFKKVLIDSQNLAQLCTQFMIPKPYTLLTNAVSRYIRWNGMELETVKDAVGNGKSRVVLKLGDMEGEAIAVGVKQAMQYAAQLLLKKMHPELLKYGSFLEMYGRLEYKERLESAKKQHDQVVRLSDTGNLTLPNYIVLGKLSEEMKNVVLSHPSRRSLFGAVNTEVVRKRSVFCQYSPEDSVPPVPPMSQYFAPGEQEVPPSDFDQRSLYPYLSPQNSLANPRKRAFPEEFLPVQPGSRLPPYQFPSS